MLTISKRASESGKMPRPDEMSTSGNIARGAWDVGVAEL